MIVVRVGQKLSGENICAVFGPDEGVALVVEGVADEEVLIVGSREQPRAARVPRDGIHASRVNFDVTQLVESAHQVKTRFAQQVQGLERMLSPSTRITG